METSDSNVIISKTEIENNNTILYLNLEQTERGKEY